MCTEDGALYVTNRDGSDTGNYLRKDQMMSLGLADTGVVTIDFHVEKDDECDDHFVYLSTSPSQGWGWSSNYRAVKFVWNCDNLEMYGQSSSKLPCASTTSCRDRRRQPCRSGRRWPLRCGHRFRRCCQRCCYSSSALTAVPTPFSTPAEAWSLPVASYADCGAGSGRKSVGTGIGLAKC